MLSSTAVGEANTRQACDTTLTFRTVKLSLRLAILTVFVPMLAVSACGFTDSSGYSTGDSPWTSTSAVAFAQDKATPTSQVASAQPANTNDLAFGATRVASGDRGLLDTIVNDMKLPNDLLLRGYENKTAGWYVGPGYVQMGNKARTSNTPQWFKDAYPSLINDEPLRAFLPWIVLFDGVGHAATNTRVHFRNMKAFYKSKRTGEWISWGSSPGVTGYATPKIGLFGGTVTEDKRVNSDGSVEVKPPTDPDLAWHGWWDLGRVPIEAGDIDAVFVTVQARLVVDNPSLPDDRQAARLLFHVGADYYIDTNTSWTVPQPGVGVSRAKQVTNEWQTFSLTTFSDVGIQEPGGGITEATFRANPPPL